MEGHAIINDRNVGKTLGMDDKIRLLLRAAPWFVWVIVFSSELSVITFVLLLLHLIGKL